MLEKFTLKNGIPVFIVPQSQAPVVSIQAWVSRGSVYESEALAGISHFLEHALFKGTKKRAVGEIARQIESRGGEINAFTSFEETAYYTTLASRYFEEGLDVIADAVQYPLFDAEEMAREREVILEEIKRAHDSPYKMVSTNLWKSSFPKTPYGRPVLGFEETVRKIDHRTLKKYFTQHYHAGTTSLFIVGDIDPGKAYTLAQKKFSRMKSGKRGSLPKNFTIPAVTAPRITCLGRDLKECHLQLAVLAPHVTHKDIPAIDLMCSAIGQGESSRLYQRLVKETQLALDAHMGLVATGRCGLATVGLTVTPENLMPALQEVRRLIQETAETGIQNHEIERVKTSLESDVVSGKETVDGYARRLGYYYIQFGEPDYEKKYLEAVLTLDAETCTQSLVSTFSQKPILSMVHPEQMTVDRKELSSLLSASTPKKARPKPLKHLPELHQKGLTRIITKTVTSLPVVSLRFIFPGGSRDEINSQFGVANLFQRLWTSGTKSYSALQIAQTLESLGASLHGFSGKNTCGLSVEFLSKHWPVIKPILTEVLLCPTFPAEEFATEKNLVMREIMSERDTPGQVCHLNFLKSLYGNHPYGRSASGTLDTVGKLLPEHVSQYYQEHIHQKQLVISTVGNFVAPSWVTELEQLVALLPATGKANPQSRTIPKNERLAITLETKQPLFQSHVLAGFVGASCSEKERYPLKLLSSCLAGQGGRLFLELRDRQSLAYTVSPICSDSPDGGMFAFYIGCSPEKLEKALKGIRWEIERVLNQPIPQKELERAKQFWLGRFELDMQRFAAQAMLFGLDEAYGLGFDHYQKIPDLIRSITAKEIQLAAQKFLKVNAAVISVVHPEKLAEERIEEAWLA